MNNVLVKYAILEVPIWLVEIAVMDCVCARCVGRMRLKCVPQTCPASAEQWGRVSVTLPVNNPSMPLVLSFPANDSRPLQSRQEIALFYGMEKKKKKRGDKKREAGERKREMGLKKVLRGTWCK